MIIEYLTDHLVERVSLELQNECWDYLNRFALQPAQAREFVRLSQKRRILKPVTDIQLAELGLSGVEVKFKCLHECLRQAEGQKAGYAAGNLLNLLLHLGIDP